MTECELHLQAFVVYQQQQDHYMASKKKIFTAAATGHVAARAINANANSNRTITITNSNANNDKLVRLVFSGDLFLKNFGFKFAAAFAPLMDLWSYAFQHAI